MISSSKMARPTQGKSVQGMAGKKHGRQVLFHVALQLGAFHQYKPSITALPV